jgi:putative oxidoreductase
MTNAQWTVPHDPNHLSLPLNERIAGGRAMWLIGRLLIGGLFLMSGMQKLTGLDQFAATLVKGGIPDTIAPMLAPIAAGAETIGGLCIAIGLFTSWASLLMIAFTIVAALVSHRFWEFEGAAAQTQMAHFMKNVMIVGAFCLLYVSSGGPCSIDRWWRDRNLR